MSRRNRHSMAKYSVAHLFSRVQNVCTWSRKRKQHAHSVNTCTRDKYHWYTLCMFISSINVRSDTCRHYTAHVAEKVRRHVLPYVLGFCRTLIGVTSKVRQYIALCASEGHMYTVPGYSTPFVHIILRFF